MAIFNAFFMVILALIALGVGLICFFYWINKRDGNLEEKSYDQNFSHHEGISHRYRHADPVVDADPVESLKRYKVDSD